MKTYKIVEKTKQVLIETFHVSAESPDEALDLYVNKLAGRLPVVHSYLTTEFEDGDSYDSTPYSITVEG